MNKVMNYAKKNGKVTISEIHKELNVAKSWVSDILNDVYGVLFDKLKFGYNTVYFILKSQRNRFLHCYLCSKPNEKFLSTIEKIKQKKGLKFISLDGLNFINELSLHFLFDGNSPPPPI